MRSFPGALKATYRRLATIGKLCTAHQQIQALMRSRNRPLYKADARTQRRATIYVVVRIPTRDIAAYRAGNPAAETILDGLQVKVGHTKSLARRQRAYRKCDRGGLQTHLWLWYYKADKRCLAERLLHLNFLDGGAQRIQTLCLGVGCGVRHREFWPLMEIGGLGRLDETAVCVLTCLGQRNPTRILIPLPIHLADIYSVILDAP
ncbi:hypothetical protein B0H12DRAFT_1239904 [Mycena haematopus]|nr:hypothetical protein B0H12DRAFT_1239904 [Mycena haematopus]